MVVQNIVMVVVAVQYIIMVVVVIQHIIMVVGVSPTLARVLLNHHFTSINDRKQTPNLTSTCATEKLSIASEIYHIW